MNTYTHTLHTHMYTYITHTHVQAFSNACIHTYITHTHMYTYITPIHHYTHTQMHKIHTYTHTLHTHTHSCTLPLHTPISLLHTNTHACINSHIKNIHTNTHKKKSKITHKNTQKTQEYTAPEKSWLSIRHSFFWKTKRNKRKTFKVAVVEGGGTCPF